MKSKPSDLPRTAIHLHMDRERALNDTPRCPGPKGPLVACVSTYVRPASHTLRAYNSKNKWIIYEY